jgi:hypothetical protein
VIGLILIGQNHLYVKMLFTGIPLFRSASNDSALFTSQRFRFSASRPDDVSSCPDDHLSIVPAVWTTCHTVRMLNKPKHHPSGRRGFPSGPSSVSRSFCSSLHPFGRLSSSSEQLSVIKASNFFPSSYRGRLLKPSRRCGFPSGRAHT